MSALPSPAPQAFEWAVASTAIDGESGDLHCVIPGSVCSVIGAIDGLGHGPEAALAARECVAFVRAHAGDPLDVVVRTCHEGLRGTRGVALTLGRIDARRDLLSWLAIGNVDGLVLRRGLVRGLVLDAVLPRGGVVGYRLPGIKISDVSLAPNDLIVFATDGIKSGFANSLNPGLGVQEIADHICSRFARGSDDALALVVRYLGGMP
jgi:negative regulator of sigma-B (phosphoserine phosphatase)